MSLLSLLGIRLPIISAPMAGVSTPALAAAVSHAGGLGSIAIGSSTLSSALSIIDETRRLCGTLPFLVNVFCHPPALPNPERESTWLKALDPHFKPYAPTPQSLKAIYSTFEEEKGMVDMLVEARVPVVSFHFGIPSTETISRLRGSGSILFATATNVEEIEAVERAGMDAVVLQGYEAGGHRGQFDLTKGDEKLGIIPLMKLAMERTRLPIIAAGGIMDGAGISSMLQLGATAIQMGTAFVACPESAASEGYKKRLLDAKGTEMISVTSGRPARTLLNKWTDAVGELPEPPEYPIAYDAGKRLNAAALKRGEDGYGAHWAGIGVGLIRALPAGELVGLLERELEGIEAVDM